MVIGGWKEATRRIDILNFATSLVKDYQLQVIGDPQVPGKRATTAFTQFATKGEMWDAIDRIKKAALRIPQTGEPVWVGQSKTKEERIRGKKSLQPCAQSAALWKPSGSGSYNPQKKSKQTTAVARSTTLTRPLATASTISNTAYIHLPNWNLEPAQLEPVHAEILQGLQDAES